jgi:hypothetical protein
MTARNFQAALHLGLHSENSEAFEHLSQGTAQIQMRISTLPCNLVFLVTIQIYLVSIHHLDIINGLQYTQARLNSIKVCPPAHPYPGTMTTKRMRAAYHNGKRYHFG